jgi:hypothetical protein
VAYLAQYPQRACEIVHYLLWWGEASLLVLVLVLGAVAVAALWFERALVNCGRDRLRLAAAAPARAFFTLRLHFLDAREHRRAALAQQRGGVFEAAWLSSTELFCTRRAPRSTRNPLNYTVRSTSVTERVDRTV